LIKAVALRQFAPAICLWKPLLPLGLLKHLQEKQVGQLCHVFVVGHAIIPKDVAQRPELCDNIPCVGHQPALFHTSSFISPSTVSSSPSNTLLSRVKPPFAANGSRSSAARSTTISFSNCSPIRRSHSFCGSLHFLRSNILCIAA